MRTISSFDFSEILNGIKSGKIDSLCIVTSQLCEDDENDPQFIESYDEVCFAGTTADECRSCINQLVSECKPDMYSSVDFCALQIPVSPEYFEDFDEECDDAEDAISEFIDEEWPNGGNIGTDDWNMQTVRYEYESMEGGIILYWSWDRYIGYARTSAKLEYCVEHIDTLHCKPIDRVFATQCTMLVSPSEMKELKSASYLRDLIQQRFDDMGKWRNDCHVDDFLKDIYEVQGRFHFYELPENDLYNDEEEEDE